MVSETPELKSAARPRFPLLGVSFIVVGLVIATLSFPVSQASHAVAEEVKKRNAGKGEVRAIAGGAVKAAENGWKFASKREENENPFTQLLKAVVAVLSLLWCCCVCLMGMLAEVLVEPIGRALDVAAQFSVYTFAGFLAVFGLIHFGAGIGLLRGNRWPRWIAQLLLVIDGSQGLCYLGACPVLWSNADPIYGIVAAGLGLVLLGWCIPTYRILAQRR